MHNIYLSLIFLASVLASQNSGAQTQKWKVVSRSIEQTGGSWQIDYKLKNISGKPVKISANDLKLTASGDVSNSVVPGHSLPITSRHILTEGQLEETNKLVKFNDKESCGEKLEVTFGYREVILLEIKRPDDFVLNNDDYFLLKLRFSHEHLVYEDYDPLLGIKALSLSVGSLQLTDTLPLDNILYTSHMPAVDLMSKITEDRRDDRVVNRGPYSLHLESHIPGNQYFRFPEFPVKYSTKIRLRFKYLIARGTCDDLSFKVAQYQDTPLTWKVLNEGSYTRSLSTTLFGMHLKKGIWRNYDEVIRVQPNATTIAIDFRFSGGNDIGEAWIDNISLREIGVTGQTGP